MKKTLTPLYRSYLFSLSWLRFFSSNSGACYVLAVLVEGVVKWGTGQEKEPTSEEKRAITVGFGFGSQHCLLILSQCVLFSLILGGLLELRLYRQAPTSTPRLFTVFLQCCSEYSLKYCFWSMKHFLVSFLFLRKTCCTFLFCKNQLESRSLSFINWAEGKKTRDWFFSLSPAWRKLVDIQSCKTNLLIQFFLRVF